MQTDALILYAVRKEVTKTLKEFMETRKKQELAATKIQAAFRGYRARKLHNMETKRADKYMFFKGITREAKDTVSLNRQSISVSICLLILRVKI
jgi:acid phosphatase class B